MSSSRWLSLALALGASCGDAGDATDDSEFEIDLGLAAADDSEPGFEDLLDGRNAPEWPTPRYVDPGEWWTALEAALQSAESGSWVKVPR